MNIQAEINKRYKDTLGVYTDVGQLSSDQLLSLCQQIWNAEKQNFQKILSYITKLRQKHESLQLIYLNNSDLAELNEEYQNRSGVLTLPEGVTGYNALLAEVQRIDRLVEINKSLQDILRDDIKLVGDEDRRSMSVRAFYWGVGLAIFTFLFSATVDIVRWVTPASKSYCFFCEYQP